MNQITFFGKTFRLTILSIVFFELLSLLSHWFGFINTTSFILITGLVFIASLYKLEWGLYAALLELIIGSKGHLFALQTESFSLSIRMGIFAVVILAWFIHTIKNKQTNLFKSFASRTYIALAVIMGLGIITALIHSNSLTNIFFDFNAWIYFAYLGVYLDTLRTYPVVNNAFQVISGAITMVAIKTLAVLFIFSHNYPMPRDMYKWVRDTGVGEITLLAGDFYRVFFQSHIYLLIGFFLFFSLYLFKGKFDRSNKTDWYILGIITLSLSGTILSLSRSNWVGFAAASLILLLVMLAKQKVGWKKTFKEGGVFTGILASSLLLIVITVLFPYPRVGDLSAGTMLKERFQADESAISSRWAQLPVLKEEFKNPATLLLGSGWGSTITYKTSDPRILQQNPDGNYTTFAFEWGYFDIMLKIGLLGLLIYIYLLWNIWKQGWALIKTNLENHEKALIIGLLMGLVSVLATNAFSPYLNHPLGIGYILFLTAIFQYYLPKTKTK